MNRGRMVPTRQRSRSNWARIVSTIMTQPRTVRTSMVEACSPLWSLLASLFIALAAASTWTYNCDLERGQELGPLSGEVPLAG